VTTGEHQWSAFGLLAVGLWLLLPPRGRRSRGAGLAAAAAGLVWMASQFPAPGEWIASGVFWLLGGLTALAALATIASRNPVYAALWFAVTLLGTAVLMMDQGAQFLGVATIVVYAGAIVVTFLFVLMLAQPDGTAFYDRIGWGWVASLGAAVAGAAFVAVVAWQLAAALPAHVAAAPPTAMLEKSDPAVLHRQHVARLGGQLLSQHLLAVELAGTLLLVALVGAVAVVAHGKSVGSALPVEQESAPRGSESRGIESRGMEPR
jgi:NADH-quinone oxidoreductase subunit J